MFNTFSPTSSTNSVRVCLVGIEAAQHEEVDGEASNAKTGEGTCGVRRRRHEIDWPRCISPMIRSRSTNSPAAAGSVNNMMRRVPSASRRTNSGRSPMEHRPRADSGWNVQASIETASRPWGSTNQVNASTYADRMPSPSCVARLRIADHRHLVGGDEPDRPNRTARAICGQPGASTSRTRSVSEAGSDPCRQRPTAIEAMPGAADRASIAGAGTSAHPPASTPWSRHREATSVRMMVAGQDRAPRHDEEPAPALEEGVAEAEPAHKRIWIRKIIVSVVPTQQNRLRSGASCRDRDAVEPEDQPAQGRTMAVSTMIQASPAVVRMTLVAHVSFGVFLSSPCPRGRMT